MGVPESSESRSGAPAWSDAASTVRTAVTTSRAGVFSVEDHGAERATKASRRSRLSELRSLASARASS